MSNILHAIILSFVQGITEFFPVSSSAHLSLVQNLFNMEEPSVFFILMFQFAMLVSILIVFRKDVISLVRASFRIPTLCKHLFQKGHLALADDHEAWTCILIIVATFSLVILSLILPNKLTESLYVWWMLPLGFFMTGCILFSTKNLQTETSKAKQKREGKAVPQVTIKDAMLVGLSQILGIVPGVSRSGVAISSALWLRVNRTFAAEFTFLMIIPVITISIIKGLCNGIQIEPGQASSLGIGFSISVLTGCVSLTYLLKWIRKGKLYCFAYYCWAMCLVILFLSLRK